VRQPDAQQQEGERETGQSREPPQPTDGAAPVADEDQRRDGEQKRTEVEQDIRLPSRRPLLNPGQERFAGRLWRRWGCALAEGSYELLVRPHCPVDLLAMDGTRAGALRRGSGDRDRRLCTPRADAKQHRFVAGAQVGIGPPVQAALFVHLPELGQQYDDHGGGERGGFLRRAPNDTASGTGLLTIRENLSAGQAVARVSLRETIAANTHECTSGCLSTRSAVR